MRAPSLLYDAIIVGGGPAGLNAAIVLGRCRRRVLVCDEGRPRNAASRALNGFLGRDGIAPLDLLRIGREEAARYGVEFRAGTVTDARCEPGRFVVSFDDGSTRASRTLLLATGVVDKLPPVDGLRELYGRGVFHCPYCDGWEVADEPLAVYGRGRAGAGLALKLLTWSRDVVLCSDGPARLSPDEAGRLRRHGVAVREARIARLEAEDGRLARIVFRRGEPLERRALFFTVGQHQRSALPERLGCRFDRRGSVRTNRLEGTGIPGLYVAGDASWDVQLAIIAAAEGAKAAFAINELLGVRS